MRIAVCLSGQLRGWETGVDNQKWFWETCNRSIVEIDYFAHTWDYSMDREGVSQPYIKRAVEKEEFDRFKEKFELKKSIFESKPQNSFYNNDHWMGLFYSLSKSLMLKREYEIENNFTYDVVIKSRPDVTFSPKYSFFLPKLNDGVLWSTHGGIMPMEFNMYNVNDCVFLANSPTMDLLMNLFFYRLEGVIESNKHNINIHPIGPGTLMHEFFRDYGITPLFLDFHETLIKEGHPRGIDLFNKEEYEKFHQYFLDWYTK